MRPQLAGPGFHGIAWREALDDVRELQIDEPVRDEGGLLVYEDWLFGWPTLVFFNFEQGILVEGRYIVKTASVDEAYWAYFLLKFELTRQCGPQLDPRQLATLSGEPAIVPESAGQPICLFRASLGTRAVLLLVPAPDGVVDVHLRYIDETHTFMKQMKARHPGLF